MLIPKFILGPFASVQRECQRRLRLVVKGRTWLEAMEDDLLNSTEHTGLLVLHGPSPLLSGRPHFHVYLPLLRAREACGRRGPLSPAVGDKIFECALKSAWSCLALQGAANQMWLLPRARHRPFISASLQFWAEFDEEGERYSSGDVTGTVLGQHTPNVLYALVHEGLPPEQAYVRSRADLQRLADQVHYRSDG